MIPELGWEARKNAADAGISNLSQVRGLKRLRVLTGWRASPTLTPALYYVAARIAGAHALVERDTLGVEGVVRAGVPLLLCELALLRTARGRAAVIRYTREVARRYIGAGRVPGSLRALQQRAGDLTTRVRNG